MTTLLNTGDRIPMVGMGTYKLSGDELYKAVELAAKNGYRMFDTAKVYGNEESLGDALEKLCEDHDYHREQFIVITKIFIQDVDEDISLSVWNDVTDSLKKLKSRNRERRIQTYIALEKLKSNGMIKAVGVSNYEQNHIEELKSYAEMMPCMNQIEMHPHFTREALLEYCKREKIFVQAFSSLAGHSPELFNDPVIQNIAQAHSCSAQEIVLSWPFQKAVGVIPKSTNSQRQKVNFNAHRILLTMKEIESIDALDRNQNYSKRCTGWLVE